MAETILRLPDVMAKVGLKRSTIYLKIKRRTFPRQISLGRGRAVGWLLSEVESWLTEKVADSRGEDKENSLGADKSHWSASSCGLDVR